MGEIRQTQGQGHGSLQSLSQGSHCPLVPMHPLWGQMGCTSRGSPPTTSLHGEPTMPLLQQDSSWTPPGNICFRLNPPLSPPRAESPWQGQSPRKKLVVPCLFSGFLSRLLQDSSNTDAARNTPSPHDGNLHRKVLQLWGPSLMPQPSAPGAAGDTFTKSWPAAGPGSRHAAIPANVFCLCEISTNKCNNYT